MSASFTESVVEQAALAWLEGVGWRVRSGAEIAPGEPAAERDDYGQVVLAQLNPALPAEATMTMLCYDGARGPFFVQDGLSYTCRPAASVLMMDGSAVLGSVGFGLGMSAESTLRERKRLQSKASFVPLATPELAGFAIVGQF